MSRKFITTIVAAAIALTSLGAGGVQAQDRRHNDRNYNTERAIAALLGLAIVGKVIHDKNKRDDRKKHERTERHRKPVVTYLPDERVKPRPLPRRVEREQPRRVNKRLLPRQCFRSFETRRGTYRGFGQRCLQNNFRHAANLPQYCLTRIRTDRGTRRVYEARCLRDQGYRLTRG